MSAEKETTVILGLGKHNVEERLQPFNIALKAGRLIWSVLVLPMAI